MWIAIFSFFGLLGAVIALIVVVSMVMGVAALVVSVLPINKVPLRYNFRNLQSRWKTTVVTALAFTLVIGLLAVMLAFVGGMVRQTENTGHPGNVMVLSDGATDEAFSNLQGTTVTTFESAVQDLVEKMPDGKTPMFSQEIYVMAVQTLPKALPNGREIRFVQLRGLDNPALSAAVHDIELAEGRWPQGFQFVKSEGQSLETAAAEVVLGHGIARTLGGDYGKETLGVGDLIDIGPTKWTVVGIMKPGATTFGSEMWADVSPVASHFNRQNAYNSYVIRTKDANTAKKAVDLLSKAKQEKTYAPWTERAYYDKLTATSKQFTGAIYFIAIVMAVGGVLGVMNTMFAAISQRSKDIGVLRLLGYGRLKILFSFMFESIVIGMLGAGLGIAASFLVHGSNVSSFVGGQGGGGKTIALQLLIEPHIITVCLVFAFIMGAVGGFIPALSAMRLKPLESLR